MSGFVVIYQRGGTVNQPECIEPMLDALGHCGPDGKRILNRDRVVFGFQHFWTTPEDEGCLQPVSGRCTDIDLVFDGRIDNREDIADALKIDSSELNTLSDPALALRAFTTWRESSFQRLLGPFAAVVFDHTSSRLYAARDLIGDRNLVFYLDDDVILLATEEIALLHHERVSPDLNKASMARFFALRPPAKDSTFFAAIQSLPPGHLLVVSPDSVNESVHTEIEDLPLLKYQRDEEFIEHFKTVFDESVRCRMRSSTSPVIQMSGGLDSTSVAAVARKTIGTGTRLKSISWVFNEIGEADERPYIEAMIQHLGLEPLLITADHYWPLRKPETIPHNPNAPWDSLYRNLMETTYSATNSGGSRVLLDGLFGDQLYMKSAYWLHDKLARGLISAAAVEFYSQLFDTGLDLKVRASQLRAAVLRVVGIRSSAKDRPPVWLTDHARQLLETNTNQGARKCKYLRPEQLDCILDALICHTRHIESRRAAHHQVELRSPYRDRRLIEFMLRLPADFLLRRGWSKWILRKAMDPLLPEKVRLRWQGSSFVQLCARGLAEREKETVEKLLFSDQALWPAFTRQEWLIDQIPGIFSDDCASAIAIWNCISMEIWNNRRTMEYLITDRDLLV